MEPERKTEYAGASLSECHVFELIDSGASFRVIDDSLSGFEHDFKTKSELGVGAYGEVVLCGRVCDGRQFAVKRIDKLRQLAKRPVPGKLRGFDSRLRQLRALRSEVDILRMVSMHPNVATLYDVYEDDAHLCLVLEFCAGGELFDRLVKKGPLKETKAASITKQLCSVLKFLHDCGVVHCDIKLENILLASAKCLQIKLVDFGMAHVLAPGEYLRHVSGSADYSAPEMVPTGGRPPHYALPCDLWAVGIVAFAITFGYPPFSVHKPELTGVLEKRKAVYRRILAGFDPRLSDTLVRGYGPWFPDRIHSSEAVRDFIAGLLLSDAKKRTTLTQALEHTWLRNATDASKGKRLTARRLALLQSSTKEVRFTDIGLGTISEGVRDTRTSIKTAEGEIDKKNVKLLIIAMGKMSRGCLFREAVAKLYEAEFKVKCASLYATMRRSFELMDSSKRGVVTLTAFSCFLAGVSEVRIDAKHVSEMYRELATPGIGEEATGATKEYMCFGDILTAAVIDYIGSSQRRLQRIFDELDTGNTGFVAMKGIFDRLKATDLRGVGDWDRVAQIVADERVDAATAGVDFVEFLSFLDPRYTESVEWVERFRDGSRGSVLLTV